MRIQAFNTSTSRLATFSMTPEFNRNPQLMYLSIFFRQSTVSAPDMYVFLGSFSLTGSKADNCAATLIRGHSCRGICTSYGSTLNAVSRADYRQLAVPRARLSAPIMPRRSPELHVRRAATGLRVLKCTIHVGLFFHLSWRLDPEFSSALLHC